MCDADEYRKRAEECMTLLSRMDERSQAVLLSIAEAWLVLAHAAEERERRTADSAGASMSISKTH
jgi:hypothetical protein